MRRHGESSSARFLTLVALPGRCPALIAIKRELTDTPDGKWQLVYDTVKRALYVESITSDVKERIGIDTALSLTGDGSNECTLQ